MRNTPGVATTSQTDLDGLVAGRALAIGIGNETNSMPAVGLALRIPDMGYGGLPGFWLPRGEGQCRRGAGGEFRHRLQGAGLMPGHVCPGTGPEVCQRSARGACTGPQGPSDAVTGVTAGVSG